ncbi:hypothetical protein CAMRE0001_0650 [Campylobacter rectus RM3267]|uniref:Uncharacterized protein n=1 Tax=Campylobacter rectus RM3267 TaxID=553218 RepID=B9D1I8_CAMRE|nr:hypothetical protein CAMRE0001_0650 [Campylobacter rectus RM3267]
MTMISGKLMPNIFYPKFYFKVLILAFFISNLHKSARDK